MWVNFNFNLRMAQLVGRHGDGQEVERLLHDGHWRTGDVTHGVRLRVAGSLLDAL